MKNLIIACALGLMTTGAAWAEEQQTNIEVSGLYCPSCKFIAGEAMKMIESVDIIEAIVAEDGESAVYVVSYDDAVTNPQEIAEWTLMYGYTSEVLVDEDSSS